MIGIVKEVFIQTKYIDNQKLNKVFYMSSLN